MPAGLRDVLLFGVKLIIMMSLSSSFCRGPRDQAGASEASRDEKRRPTVALVDRQLFERILFSFDTMPHHLPDTYLSAVQQL